MQLTRLLLLITISCFASVAFSDTSTKALLPFSAYQRHLVADDQQPVELAGCEQEDTDCQQEILDDSATDLLVNAVSGNVREYQRSKQDFFNALQINRLFEQGADQKLYVQALDALSQQQHMPISYYAWQLGRALLAADHIQDDDTAITLAQTMRRLLVTQSTIGERYHTWAWGYLATHDAHVNQQYYHDDILHLRQSIRVMDTHDHQGLLWGHVWMTLSAAIAKDDHGYQDGLTGLQYQFENTAFNSVEHMAWAVTLVRVAAALEHDEETYELLDAPLQQMLPEIPSSGFKTLIVVHNQLAEGLWQKQQARKLGIKLPKGTDFVCDHQANVCDCRYHNKYGTKICEQVCDKLCAGAQRINFELADKSATEVDKSAECDANVSDCKATADDELPAIAEQTLAAENTTQEQAACAEDSCEEPQATQVPQDTAEDAVCTEESCEQPEATIERTFAAENASAEDVECSAESCDEPQATADQGNAADNTDEVDAAAACAADACDDAQAVAEPRKIQVEQESNTQDESSCDDHSCDQADEAESSLDEAANAQESVSSS